jgi:uncharacterized protein (TIGR00661 family)
MKYLFFIQGEGRGHMTQALTLKEKLESRGHEILAAVVGIDKNKELPSFFRQQINIPLFTVDSPGFAVDKKGKGIKIFKSVRRTIWRLPLYFHSLKKIKKIVTDLNPDILISFYEPTAGNYCRLYREKRRLFCLGHQYFIGHPSFEFPEIGRLKRWSFKLYNRLSAPRRAVKIALSFTAEDDRPLKKLFVCPPLIRRAVKEEPPRTEDFFLLYLLNVGYSEEIIAWSQAHPSIKIEAFWNRPGEEETRFGQNLIFHRLNNEKFIKRLAACRAYVATAGFESIAEAAYLKKNILMIPTKNHFEQKCNAGDARRAGLAITAEIFNLSLITDRQTKTHSASALDAFKEWVDNYNDKIIGLLEK